MSDNIGIISPILSPISVFFVVFLEMFKKNSTFAEEYILLVMRILYITDALAVWGGIERVLRDKANYLVEHYGYDVYIVTTDQGDHPIPYPLDERIHVHDLNIRYHRQYMYHGIKRVLKFWELNHLFVCRLRDIIREIRPDILVCIRLEEIRTIVKAKGGLPLICESHSMCYANHYENTSIFNRLRLFISRRYIRKADCIVALTEGDANDWRHYNKNVRVIPNVVHLNDNGRFSALDSKIVIFAGRFTDQKDLWSLLKIWKLVHVRYPEWELHVYGEGEHKQRFINESQRENLNIKVFSPTSNIFDMYLDSSMLVMTSCYEPFGLVLPEAMSCGLPVIAFNCPYGPSEIITDGVDGSLINNRDVNDFANHICSLIENTTIRETMGKSAIESSYRFRAERIMPLWDSLFSNLLKR